MLIKIKMEECAKVFRSRVHRFKFNQALIQTILTGSHLKPIERGMSWGGGVRKIMILISI